MVIAIAGINIDVNLIYENEFKTLKNYKVNGLPEFFINSSFDEFNIVLNEPFMKTEFFDKYKIDNKIVQRQKTIDGKYYAYIVYDGNRVDIYNDEDNTFIEEYLLSQYAIFSIVCDNTDSLLFHSSTIKYNNIGIAFSAKSGTGKSTHRRLWQKYSDCIAINDDKNIITLKDDKLYISPNPWCGKHFIENNVKSTLDVIVFLYQAKENGFMEISKAKGFKLLLGQIVVPNDNNKEKWNRIVDKILELPILYYGCNMEYDAFRICKERIEEVVKQ
ncbi:MAG: hypothetical protein IKP77_01880 [Acholeplasmatales bacterium]|nr:hypothetical protein [Acholeplasmatales bacterium]